MIQKQIVYLPIKEHSVFKILESGITLQNCYPEEGYFFTPEELNEYTDNVIRKTLETAAEKGKVTHNKILADDSKEGNNAYIEFPKVNKQSITDTFEETFKLFEV